MIPSHSTLSDLERSNSRSLRFWSLVSRKRAELGHMFLLNINRKPYIGSSMTLSHLTLSDLETSISRSLRYQRLISRKKAELGYMLLLDTNRKSYMGKPPSYLTLSDLEKSKLRCWIWSKIDTCVCDILELTLEFTWFSLPQSVFDASLQKIANVLPTAALKQSAKVHGTLVLKYEVEYQNKRPRALDLLPNRETNTALWICTWGNLLSKCHIPLKFDN